MLLAAALDLPLEQRHALLEVLVAVAAADGAIVAEEAACVESIMGAVMLHPEARAGLRNQLTDPPLWSASLAEIDGKHARTVLFLAAYVAAVDGAYDKEEVRLLRQMCKALDVESSLLEEAFIWVESGLNWMASLHESTV
ncbi:MAG TPA: TerB family tellurite resistance protein [Candidatus Poseidoniaceae archaeon]|nr:MAG: TerB family tellurite resistance protein [Euryarchaeota archaeon TMED141]DAC10684.1 MAG TPA: TerB family tellurite resistance protein [Candidatus Poseidoniales archaeon]DAC18322.1 MAG TPA: TerB family tellurite resistance protein [Candidatus Poseidoniales archaeon]HII96457.1 TerB family tellurite resistance protein [Candidatus Poseidoniaceae archaeon]